MSFESTKKSGIFGAPKNSIFFEREKREFLKKPDKSLAKGIDKAILPLVNQINSKKNFYTTSSCSGRITLIKETGKKQEHAFLFRSHEKVNFKQINKIIEQSVKNYKGIVYLKHEPCIMHVACRTFDDSLWLTNIARQAGWKKSGIISRKNIVEMLSTEILAAPVAARGKIIITDDYQGILVNECNKKLAQTRQKIKNLEKALK